MASHQRDELIDRLKQASIRHTPENIVGIAELVNGNIVFLEVGDIRSGLQHILAKHADDFARCGIRAAQIPGILIAALQQGKIIDYQGHGFRKRPIYEVNFEGNTHYIAITVASNGYIVGANPVSF